MRIVVTGHAQQRMIERGVSRSEVRAAILRGAKRSQGKKLISAYRYFEVVYRLSGNVAYVVTVKPRW